MVKKSFKSQLHKDQLEYVSRVFGASGSITTDAQTALNRFIKFHYSKGLRDSTNNNHIVRHCSVYPTRSKNGSNQNLWFINGKNTHFSGSDSNYGYTDARGMTILSNLKIDTDVTASSLATSDISIGFFCTRISENTGYLGALSGTFPSDARIFSHPQYTGSTGIYFDVGNDNTARRVVGTVSPISGDKNNKGLTICAKSGNNGLIQHKYSLRGSASNLVPSPPAPTTFMEHFPGTQPTDRLDIGGYWYGRNVPQPLLESLVNEWEALQTAIHPERSQFSSLSPDNFLGLEAWYDAKDSGTLTFTTGNSVSGWADKSGRSKNLRSQIDGRTALYNGTNGLNMNGNQGVTTMRREDSCYWGCIAVIFTPSVTSNNGGTNNNHLLGFFLGNTTSNHTGISLGSVTSYLNNEVISINFEHTARIGYTTTAFSFNANSKYVVIFNRRSSTAFDIVINGVYVPVTTTANVAANNTYVANRLMTVGGRFNNARNFLGVIHEIAIYRNGLTQSDLSLLSSYLMSANGIS